MSQKLSIKFSLFQLCPSALTMPFCTSTFSQAFFGSKNHPIPPSGSKVITTLSSKASFGQMHRRPAIALGNQKKTILAIFKVERCSMPQKMHFDNPKWNSKEYLPEPSFFKLNQLNQFWWLFIFFLSTYIIFVLLSQENEKHKKLWWHQRNW